MKFKEGDRVAVYTNREGRITGKVEALCINRPDVVFVIEDGFYSCHNDSPFHIKQCRKLRKKVKREPRRYWLNRYKRPGGEEIYIHLQKQHADLVAEERLRLSGENFERIECIEVVEVIK